MTETIDAVALFSGGLDSILAARLMMEQGIRIRCLHFISPFFGKAKAVGYWHKIYGLDIEVIDLSDDYIAMLQARPAFGFGKVMNPCVDCKILMLKRAKQRMLELNATMIVSGAVVGQRPMSQRRDAMNIICREADVYEYLVRPLCAKQINPSVPEQKGLVDRNRLENFFGRGRDGQIALAQRMGIVDIPTPAGGCKLCEKENARRYWTVLTRVPHPTVADFELANVGRQVWSDHGWMAVGRNASDNDFLQTAVKKDDYMIKILDFPGPIALLRPIPGQLLMPEEMTAAARFVGMCTPKAVKSAATVSVRVTNGNDKSIMQVDLKHDEVFTLPLFETVRAEIHPMRSTR